jgi:hypothetical protein
MNTRWLRTRVHGATRWLPLCLSLCGATAAGCGSDDNDGSGSGSGGQAGSSMQGGAGAAGKAAGSGGAAGRAVAGAGGQAAGEDAGISDDAAVPAQSFSFFVTSDTSKTGDLGGLKGADARCQKLAGQVAAGGKTWHAYLSADHAADGGGPVHAKDRIGKGPWYNVNGQLLAQDLGALHMRDGDAALFLDEHGHKINGQWSGSPTPNEHDVLTGSQLDGTLLADKTCKDWTSSSADDTAQVGHTDGLGPMQNGAPPYNSWNSVHENGGCNDTAPRGGAGKLYCFAID